MRRLKSGNVPARENSAIALARERGMDTSLWESELKELERRFEEAEEIARHTEDLLASRGWCLWRCDALGGDIIGVAKDEGVDGIPEGVPVYTEAELGNLFSNKPVTQATLRLIHGGKKQGAVITVPACWRGARCLK